MPVRITSVSTLAALCCCIFTISTSAQEPEELRAETDSLLRQGAELRWSGDLDGALERYNAAYELQPHHPSVLYEMSAEQFALNDYHKCITYANEGSQYAGRLQAQFFAVLGNCYDLLKEPERAIESYERGIALAPEAPMLHYNLAVTYLGMDNVPQTLLNLKRELLLNPEHAGSHYALATVYAAAGERVPAILAYSRFLLLEHEGSRSRRAVGALKELMEQGISNVEGTSENDEKKSVEVTVDMSDSEEGDLKSSELMVGLLGAYRAVSDSVPKSEYMQQVEGMTTLVETLQPNDDADSGFASRYYAAYFAAARDAGFAEEMVRAILVGYVDRKDPDAIAWWASDENYERIQSLVEWMDEYAWPTEL